MTEQRTIFLLGPERVELRWVPVPEPGPGELLVKIGAATTCGTDVKVLRRGGHPRMLVVPTPFGHEMAGTIAAVGPEAESWKVGDRVVVANSAPCGECEQCLRQRENLCENLRYLNGAFAEYVLVPRHFAEVSTYTIPDELPFEVAALAEPLACVLHGLEVCPLDGGADTVVYGGGPIGLLFVNLLADAGHHVVLADPNSQRLESARRMGAAEAVLVSRDGGEAARLRRHAGRGDGFDLAIEATGSPVAWEDALASVRSGGTVLLFGGCRPGTFIPLDTHRLHYLELTIKGAYHHRPATFQRALDLLATGRIRTAELLSAERPLEEVEGALRSMMRKEALKVVIRP
ncbi:MAG TPA: alcohol dehydrogenase catalytic domain-containing protein [Thermoanaerobaculia bacterium]|nr:alcohol dehydrogenase catalytic domain-containing protein [Thermoanaerobaculia bacterium]